MTLNVFSNSRFNFDWTVALFYKSKINSHGVYVIKKKKSKRKVSLKSKKRRHITVNSHSNSSETNNSNTSNSDDVIGNSNLPPINIHTKISLKTHYFSKTN